MQDSYIFGLKAKKLNDAAAGDFKVIENVAGSKENHNPYGPAYLNDPNEIATTPDDEKVTSIPSPYARMHITDIAFRELMAGEGVMDGEEKKEHIQNMSGDYLRAMSHCLDLYEMMFHFKDLDLVDKGITIKRIDLVTGKDGRYRDLLNGKPELKSFIETLDLFRTRYVQDIKKRTANNYSFDFSQMYIFKYKGTTFAATSPFTGFFAKADCDLSKAELIVTWKQDGNNRSHKLFTNTPKEWLGIKERDPKFIEFLYLLLRDEFYDIFRHLFKAVEDCIADKSALSDVKFMDKYPEFNFGELVLPQIAGGTGNESYIRPNGLDSSYLKYILFLREPVDLSISEEAYKKDIEDRVFPEGSENKVPWIGVNDFLSDALIVLPYDINDNYYAATYIDENLNPHRRCLLPVKRKALEYIQIERIINNLHIKKYDSSHYSVTLTLTLTTGGKVELRRDYYDVEDENCVFPNGALKDLQNKGHHFAFGIYPFVKSENYENLYKVLFYNDFTWPEGYHAKENEKPYSLDFYYFDNNDRATAYDVESDIDENQTNRANKKFNVNTHYFNVAKNLKLEEGFVSIDFAELSLKLVKNPASGNPTIFNATAIIAPKYHDVEQLDGATTIAVDLGTSNTFIAYEHGGEEAREISTIHDGWSELTLMNKAAERNDANKMNLQDLYLRTNDGKGAVEDDYCLPAQLCEFIPTLIKQSSETDSFGYNFPIPTVINNLLIDGKEVKDYNDRIALVNSAIPFAYYTMGKRPGSQDHMFTGEFKWFYNNKNRSGIFKTDQTSAANFKSFLKELLFIVRSHMLCRGIKLEECRLLWTYPLSFQPELIKFYQKEWSMAYCLYFNTSLLDGSRTKVVNKGRLAELVKYTNESRTPIYECIENPADANHLTVLMDVGGGSTDVIGYKHHQPKFITSFGFAGNALYLGGSKNTLEEDLRKNYMRKFVELTCKHIFDESEGIGGTKKIGTEDSINTLMNYGFSEAYDDFAAIFDNEPIQFMLKLHNASLIYHAAQLCKIESPDEMPVQIYLTGNGSKLFELNKDKDAFIRKIIGAVYGKECSANVTSPEYPKAATAIGSLKGIKKEGRGALKFNEESTEQQVVMLGDADTRYSKDEDNAIELNGEIDYTQKVKENVKEFIDVFYEVLNIKKPYFSKEDVLKCIEYVKDDEKLQFGDELTDSMFFQYISLLMEQLSIKIYDKIK